MFESITKHRPTTRRTYHKMRITVDLADDDEMTIDLAKDVSASVLSRAQPLTSLQATLSQLRGF
jgi:hypothetical protein